MIKSAYGIGRDSGDAVSCVKEAVKDLKDPKLIIFFSGEKNFPEYSRILNEMFPDAVCIGCSTYRTWNCSGTEKDVLSVTAVEDGVTCSAGAIEKVDNFVIGYADIVRDCYDKIDSDENTICVEFTVPFKRKEEYTLMALNSVLLRHNIPVIGGTAANTNSDANGFVSKDAYVSLNGKVYDEGSVFVLIHNINGRILLYKENIYEPLTGDEFMVTKANSITRTIMTFNNKPALSVYSNELNIPPENIGSFYFHYPMGRIVGGDTFITAIEESGSNGSMKFHARVHEGTKMMVMKEGNYRLVTKRTLREIKSMVPDPSLVMMFQCVACTSLYEEEGYVDEYQDMLSKAFSNFTGFSCMGEQLGTKHFNHTMIMAIFE